MGSKKSHGGSCSETSFVVSLTKDVPRILSTKDCRDCLTVVQSSPQDRRSLTFPVYDYINT